MTEAVRKQREPPPPRRPRLRFRLTFLFALTAVVAFVFAYPRFVIGSIALFAGVVVAFCGFVAVVYYPVVRAANWLNRRDKPDEVDSH